MAPQRTALVVVDMQNAFVKKGAGHAWIPAAADTCGTINRLAEALRHKGGTVVWILNTFTEESLQSWSHFHENLSSPAGLKLRSETMSEGHMGHALYSDLKTEATDWHVPKTRYSAFIQGASDLHERLQKEGIDTVLIAGTATNVCCESTARDAMMLNYRTVMLSDGCSAFTEQEHTLSLSNFMFNFGDVQTCDQAAENLRQSAAKLGS
jgi:ureidoacrylate peracid hydrolase